MIRRGEAHKGRAHKSRARATMLVLTLLVAAMGGLSYASVPLYELFCQVTGYGGTTRVAARPSETVADMADRSFTIRFDANIQPALNWSFRPAEKAIEVKAGENTLAFYRTRSLESEAVVGTATFNVSPDKAGLYFNKVDCFCFTEQVLRGGEEVEMPVSFFIDPEIATDPDLDEVTTITLSYTFFRADDQSAAAVIEQAGLNTSDTSDVISPGRVKN